MIKYSLKYGIEIALDVENPSISKQYSINAPNTDLASHLKNELEAAYGLHGRTITDSCSAIDLNVALSSPKLEKWQARLLEGQEILDSYEPPRIKKGQFAAKAAPKAKGGKGKGKKNCDKGINCGGGCISAKKKCKKDNPTPTAAKKAKPKGKGGGGGGSQQEMPISQRDSLPPLDEAKMAGFVAKINELESANDRDSVELADVRFRWEKTKTSATELLELLDRDDSLVANILDRNKEIAKIQKEAADVLGQWRAELIDTGLDRNAARSLLKNITTGRFADRDRKEIEAALVEFHQLTNGAIGGRLRSIVKTTDRAYSEPSIGRVNPGVRESKESYKQTLFHEFAHLAEDVESRQIHNNWVRQRGGNTGDLTSLNTIIGTDRYRADEVTTKDEFISPYVGKYYGDPTALKTRAEGWDRADTEVLSMGLEKFSDKDSMLDLYLRDREHFGLIVNFLERKRNVSIQN